MFVECLLTTVYSNCMLEYRWRDISLGFLFIVNGCSKPSVFRHRIYENVSLLGYCAGNIGNFLPTFPVNLSLLGDGIDARS